jgi:hypothetical protein
LQTHHLFTLSAFSNCDKGGVDREGGKENKRVSIPEGSSLERRRIHFVVFSLNIAVQILYFIFKFVRLIHSDKKNAAASWC